MYQYQLCHKCSGVVTSNNPTDGFGRRPGGGQLYGCGCISSGHHGPTVELEQAKANQVEATLQRLSLYRAQGRSQAEIERLLSVQAALHGVQLS